MGLVIIALVTGIADAAPARDNGAMSRELFRFDTLVSVADWSAIDDSVMGGVSHSRLRHDAAGHAVFEGVVSLENSGGFASVRSRPLDLGVSGAANYTLEVRGDGKRYKLSVRAGDAFDGIREGLIKPSKSPSSFTSLAFGDTITTDFDVSGPAMRVSRRDFGLSGAADATIPSSPTTAVVPSTNSTARTA